ncbi:hypothetical protein J5Y04_23380 [Kitasatospora sp. RG8]|uniref:hypothetical protein n=1 Tax=Kitasatospora sp. RG8 TaxID=2820815 RepID=UPI001ADF509F|nr:hypothetical protein [Kitasatospora sp. RG8]MBP0452461.1 hypothetical protein [Kitasatospora sp. RG8]
MTDLATDRPSGSELSPDGSGTTRSDGSAGGSAGARWTERRWVLVTGEVLVSVVAALGFTLLCRHISVNPLNRIGQVSGLAKIQQYAALIGLPVLAVLVYTAYRGGLRRHGLVQRLVCAALAGLSTGVIAGGVVVALRGTPWPLGGQEGDPSVLVDMATSMMHDKGLSGVYPPLFPAAIALWSEIRYGGVGGAGFALHDLQIVCSALVGPMSYLAWRLMLRPFWALAIAVPSALVFLDPIRPYSHVTMIVLLPLLAACLRELRRAGELSTRSLLLRGTGFGVVFGVLFLWYSGWYLWSAPGVFLLTLFVFPWRRGRQTVRRGLLFLAATVVTAGAIGSPLLYQIVKLGADTPDRYAYIVNYVDPAYVLGWMSDRNGQLTYHNWPQAGELAGQTGFGIMLIVAVGIGVGLGLRNMVVRVAAAVLAGAWLLRFWFASHMAHSQTIQLYPRTTWIIMYCLLILAVVGLMVSLERGAGWLERTLRSSGRTADGPAIPRRVTRQLAAGLICAMALFATMGASWSVDRYMPQAESTNTMGLDAWRAHTIKKKDGTCPKFSPVAKCADIITKDWKPDTDKGFIWCANVSTEDWPAVCGRQAPWLKEQK